MIGKLGRNLLKRARNRLLKLTFAASYPQSGKLYSNYLQRTPNFKSLINTFTK